MVSANITAQGLRPTRYRYAIRVRLAEVSGPGDKESHPEVDATDPPLGFFFAVAA